MSMAPDYVVEVRDRDFAVLGQIAPEQVHLLYVEVFNGPGTWQLKLPSEHPLLNALKTKGAGIIVTQLSSGHVYSGRMKEAVLSQDASDPKGTWLITGIDDNILGSAVAVFPDPANEADAQTDAYWTYTADGETVMKAAVQLNAGSAAIASREYDWLTVAANENRGATVGVSYRFQPLGEVLSEVAARAGLGWRFYQQGAGIEFDVYEPTDKTALIQLDIRNGGLDSTQLGFTAPTATDVLVLGQGQGENRTVRKVTSTPASDEAALWGLRWEVVKDQRNTDDSTELQQAGEEILAANGATVHSLKVTPSDAPNQRLGLDWGLGDIVTVVIDGSPAEATVTEVATSITSAGLIRTATVGDPVGFDWEAKVAAKVRETSARVANLEKLVDSGLEWAAITGKPSTFPPSAHTHPWAEVTGKPSTFAPSAHNHDDRYYTETEVNALLAARNLAGLVPIIPTAGTGVTVDAAGVVTLNGTSCDILDVFSAAFRDYLVSIDIESATQQGLWLRFRNAGTVYASGYEYAQATNAGATSGTATGSASVSDSQAVLDGGISGQLHWGTLDILRPFLTQSTRWDGGFSSRRTAGPLSSTSKRGGILPGSNSHTGVRLLGSGGGTITGTLQFWGRANA